MCLNGRLPSFYALPKIHKPGIPLRPIVSYCTSPLQPLAKFLKCVLSPLVGTTEHHIKNSTEFSLQIQ